MKKSSAFALLFSSVDLRFIGSAKNVVDAHTVEIGKDDQRLRWWNALAGFVFRQESLLDASFHLKPDLS